MTARHLTPTLLALIPWLATASDKVNYNSEVRPILSDKCFLCHGPDTKNNQAELRLDTPEGAFAAFKNDSSKHAIVPGSLEKSDAWQRIISNDPDEIMPTPKSNLKLTASEKDIIKRWIEQGAEYEPHWSFVDLPDDIPVPKTGTDWPKNPIDHFVAAKLKEEELEPSPEAEPVRWFRRASFSVTGLPPTLAQLETFENDLKSDPATAYEKAADSLLASRAYAEHMATPWLDSMRYADTWGYHMDPNFTAWPYRDYVIKAYQADMPFKQFVTENIAGDLLPNATPDQKLATASNRFNRMTNEGGSDQQEFFIDGVADRVNTMGTAYLGLTMECAKCHDHKYDPILAKDYYQLFAFFNSINEDGLYVHSRISPPPSLLLPTDGQQKDYKTKKKRVTDLEEKLEQIRNAADPAFETWKATLEPGSKLTLADQSSHFDFEKGQGKPLESRIQPAKPRKKYDSKKKKEIELGPIALSLASPQYVKSPAGFGIALDGDRGASLPDVFEKDRYDPFTMAMWVKDTLREERSVVIAQRCFGTEVGYNGIDLRIENGFLSARIFRAWPGNGIGIRSVKPLPKDQWHHLTYTYDGRSKAAGLRLYLDGKPIETTVLNDKLHKSVAVRTYRNGRFTIGSIFRGPGFKGGQVDELKTFDRALSPIEVRSLTSEIILTEVPDEALRPYFLANHHEEYRKTSLELVKAWKDVVKREDSFIEVPVMEEMSTPRPAFILHRGDFDKPTVKVKRDSPSFLRAYPDDAPRNRLGLAQWLTDPRHPLLTRVYVNRIWQQLFGEGLVRTAENFGLQGDLPTHPQLLDWLARDFITQGWSTKKLVRQIILSATFRQQSALTADLAARDIDNKLLARGPAHRLSGEEIRDAALVTAGLLIPHNGGHWVRPYAPNSNGKEKASQVHRRSVYSYWKRTKPQPGMTIFDKPSLEVCSVKRSRTNSPAQALVLLNDLHFVEAARVLGAKMLKEKATIPERIETAWKTVTSVEPSETELRILTEILDEQRAFFKENPKAAEKFLKTGVTPQPKELDPIESAAMAVVCQAIYSSDPAVWKR